MKKKTQHIHFCIAGLYVLRNNNIKPFNRVKRQNLATFQEKKIYLEHYRFRESHIYLTGRHTNFIDPVVRVLTLTYKQ